MASNAVSFQGATLHIGGTSGGAKNITALTKAYRAEVTSATHGLAVGDRVTFASVGGMTEINALVGTVLNVATNTFVVDIDSRAFTTYTSGGTATPVTWTQVKDIKSIQVEPGSRSEWDKTNLDSTAKEKGYGLKNMGSVSGDCNIDLTDTGQLAMRAALGVATSKPFKITLATGKVNTFSGYVLKISEGGAVDAGFTGSYEIGVDGDMTWA